MSKFKVGDKVRIVSANHAQFDYLIGCCCKVTAVIADIPRCGIEIYELDHHPNPSYRFQWREDELELVEPNSTHKIDCNITENFFKERKRMCDTLKCSKCPLRTPYDDCADIVVYHHDKAMEIIQKWSDEHPVETTETVKTIKDDYYKKFPNVPKGDKGEPKYLCPHYLGYCEYSCNHDCTACWNRPLSEVKK